MSATNDGCTAEQETGCRPACQHPHFGITPCGRREEGRGAIRHEAETTGKSNFGTVGLSEADNGTTRNCCVAWRRHLSPTPFAVCLQTVHREKTALLGEVTTLRKKLGIVTQREDAIDKLVEGEESRLHNKRQSAAQMAQEVKQLKGEVSKARRGSRDLLDQSTKLSVGSLPLTLFARVTDGRQMKQRVVVRPTADR